MRPDVIEFRDFYDSRLGQVARRILAHRIRTLWPNVRGASLLGLGYAAPFLRMFVNEAARVAALMPEEQGGIGWPRQGPCHSVLVSETQLPLPDIAAERVLVIHSLEMSEAVGAYLRELWRVLAPEGRLLLVVPNRRGLWAQTDATPFGYGRPYSRRQIEALLRASLFTPVRCQASLFMPPIGWKPFLHSAVACERVGRYVWPAFAGVLIVEAAKQVYAAVPEPKRKPAQARVRTIGKTAVMRSGCCVGQLGPHLS